MFILDKEKEKIDESFIFEMCVRCLKKIDESFIFEMGVRYRKKIDEKIRS